MNLLLDTHIALWAARRPDRIDEETRGLLARAESRILSAVVTWELAIKSGLHKLTLSLPPREWTAKTALDLDARLLDITHDHAAAVADLPPVHRDPFDRLLVAQATVEGMTLLTADPVLAGYGPVVRGGDAGQPVSAARRRLREPSQRGRSSAGIGLAITKPWA